MFVDFENMSDVAQGVLKAYVNSIENGESLRQAFIKAEERLGYETRIYSMVFAECANLFSADSVMRKLIEASFIVEYAKHLWLDA